MPPPRRRQVDRVAESSERLLAAAITLIAEQGYAKTTAADIGARAGYSRAMVRERYGSKDALLESLLRRHFEPMWIRDATEGEGNPEARSGLDEIVGRILDVADVAQKNAELVRALWMLTFESVGTVTLVAWMKQWLVRYRLPMEQAIGRGQLDGSVRKGLDARLEGEMVVATGLGIAYTWCLDPDVDLPGQVAAWADQVRERLAIT